MWLSSQYMLGHTASALHVFECSILTMILWGKYSTVPEQVCTGLWKPVVKFSGTLLVG